jgi:hypothetical protein
MRDAQQVQELFYLRIRTEHWLSLGASCERKIGDYGDGWKDGAGVRYPAISVVAGGRTGPVSEAGRHPGVAGLLRQPSVSNGEELLVLGRDLVSP